MQYNSEIIRIQTEIEFEKWYQEYKQFIGYDDLDTFKLEFYYSKEHCTSWCEHPNSRIEPHIIHINELLLLTHGINAKATAFHEFTHIYDHCKLLQNIKLTKDDKNGLLLAYTEYHAVTIQMMIALRFQSIQENKVIKMTDIVYDEVKTQNVKEYLDTQTYNAKITTKAYLEKMSVKDAIEAIRHTIYYFAMVDFFRKYIDDKQMVEQYIDLHYFTKLFGTDIVVLHLLLDKCNIDNIDDFKKIKHLYCKIGSDYLKNNK